MQNNSQFIELIKMGNHPEIPRRLTLSLDEYKIIHDLLHDGTERDIVYLQEIKNNCPDLWKKKGESAPSPQYQTPAFPFGGHPGLSKREYIAAQLMAVFSRRYTSDPEAAHYAVKGADALLAELNKTQAPENDGTNNGALLDDVKPKTEEA